MKEFAWDPGQSKNKARTHRKCVVGGGPAAGNRRQKVEPRFRKIIIYVCVLWALNRSTSASPCTRITGVAALLVAVHVAGPATK